jgi:hypothetical protein
MIASALEIVQAAEVTASPTPTTAPDAGAKARAVAEMGLVPTYTSEDPTDDVEAQQQQQQHGNDGDDASRRSSAAALIGDNDKAATVAAPTTLHTTTTTRTEPVRGNNEIHALFRRRMKFMFLKPVEKNQQDVTEEKVRSSCK